MDSKTLLGITKNFVSKGTIFSLAMMIVFFAGISTIGSALASSFDVIYSADVLPENDGFPFSSSSADDGCLLREILPGGIYHMMSNDGQFCLQSADNWNANPITGFTVEAKVKVNSFTGDEDLGGIAIFSTSPDAEAILILREDSIKEYFSGQIFLMDTTDNFHTYRITIKDSTSTIYVDDVLVLTGATADLNRNELLFGDGSNDAGGDVEWDCVAYTNSGSFSPVDLPSACDNEPIVGGELIPIELTSLLLAGTQSTTWLIPIVLAVIGIGLVLVRRK